MNARNMQRIRAITDKLWPLLFPDRAAHEGQVRSLRSRLATPYTFSPELSRSQALVAVVGALTRIFGACILFALWGGASALVLNAIGSHFWRLVVLPPLIAILLAALATLMIAISTLERRLGPKRKA